jgi:hypothetical protein
MRALTPSRGLSPRLRLQFVLILLIVWDVIGLLAELSFGGPLFKIADGRIGGLIAARGSLGGALVVPLTLYIYALVRGPMRYRGLVWIGVLEQSMVAVFAVYHAVADDIKPGGAIIPIVISLALVALLLMNMPRGQETS